MAFSDWDIVAGTTSAALNSGLSNPLPPTVGGNFSRLFSGSPAPSITNNKPEFVNIPSTKAISMSFCMRRLSGFSSGSFGGVRVKATTPQSNLANGQGYGLMMRSGASGQIVLRVNNGDELTIDGLPTPSFYSTDWIRLRLDVFPIGLSADQLVVYRETVIGSGVWDQLGISGGLPSAGVLINSASPQYAPWGAGLVYVQSASGLVDLDLYFDTVELSATTV